MENMQKHQQKPTDKMDGQRQVQGGPEETRSFQRDGSSSEREGSNHPLISSKRVNGSAVYNQAGEKIGDVEDLAIDKRSGKVAYAILSFGGFMGLGEKHQPLPWSALTYDTDCGGYVVDVTEEFLQLAPKLDRSELSGWDDTADREAFYSYYGPLGARPYW